MISCVTEGLARPAIQQEFYIRLAVHKLLIHVYAMRTSQFGTWELTQTFCMMLAVPDPWQMGQESCDAVDELSKAAVFLSEGCHEL